MMVPVKQFYVFAGDNYYPGAAFSDFKASFMYLEDAEAYAEELKGRYRSYGEGKQYDWVEVVNILQYQR